MPKKYRHYRNRNEGLTPYMMWILCGYPLGWRVILNDKSPKRFYTYTNSDSKRTKLVHSGPVNTLVAKHQCLGISSDKTLLLLTTKGVDIIKRKFNNVNVKFKYKVDPDYLNEQDWRMMYGGYD